MIANRSALAPLSLVTINNRKQVAMLCLVSPVHAAEPLRACRGGYNHQLRSSTIGHCGCGAQAEKLPCKATFSEEIALVQNADCGFLPDFRHNGEFYLSLLYIKNSVGRIALSKDRLLFGKCFDLPTAAVDGRKERLGIEFAEFIGRYHECHDGPPSTAELGLGPRPIVRASPQRPKSFRAELWGYDTAASSWQPDRPDECRSRLPRTHVSDVPRRAIAALPCGVLSIIAV